MKHMTRQRTDIGPEPIAQSALCVLVTGTGDTARVARWMSRDTGSPKGAREPVSRRPVHVVLFDREVDGLPSALAAAYRCDLALIVLDARLFRPGDLGPTCALLAEIGIPRVVTVVDAIDAVSDPAGCWQDVVCELAASADASGTVGGGAVLMPPDQDGPTGTADPATRAWHDGSTLDTLLEAVLPRPMHTIAAPLRLLRSNAAPGAGEHNWRGHLLTGAIAVGDLVRLLPSGQLAQVRRLARDGAAGAPPGCNELVSVELSDDKHLGPDTVVTAADAPCGVADRFEISLVPLRIGAELGGRWDLDVCGQSLAGTVSVDGPAGSRAARRKGTLQLDRSVAFDLDPRLPWLHVFALRAPGGALHAIGRLRRVWRKADDIHVQSVAVTQADRAALKGQKPCVVWFTGLSGAGKSTISNLVEQHLLRLGRHSYLLDGDNVRHGLNKDLGFSDTDRSENIRRIAEVARLMADAGLIVLVAFISPFLADRAMARSLMKPGEFIEVFVDAPLTLAEQRDPKGLYRKARRGELKAFTGIDSPYEPPVSPELHLKVAELSAERAARQVVDLLMARERPT